MPTRRSLKTADAKLKLIEEGVGAGTWTWDLETYELYWSPGLYRILGVDPHAVVPSIDFYQSLVHPDDQRDFDDAIGIVSDKRLENRRLRIIRPDGSLRWLQSSTQTHLDRNGKAVMLVGIMRDVTEEELLRAALAFQRDSNRLLAKLVEGRVWRAHANGKLIETADWFKLTGQTAKEAHDWTSLAAIHPDDRDRFRSAWRIAIANAEKFDLKMRVRKADGEFVWFHSQALPLLDTNGLIEQWVGHSAPMEDKIEIRGAASLLDSGQIRAARALLNWSGPELAAMAAVSFSTLRRMEIDTNSVKADNVYRVKAVLESAGVSFSVDGGSQVSVTYRAPFQPTLSVSQKVFSDAR